jgi:hypothetical protein
MRQNQNVGLCVILAAALFAARPLAAAEQRTYSAGRFSVDLNGERQLVNSVEGGAAVGVVAANGTDKRIAGVKFEDIVFSVPLTSLPKPLSDALDGKPASINGGIDYLNVDFKSQRRIAFQNATVAAVRFPALDGSSKDVAAVEITLAPQQTREEPGAGGAGDVKTGSKQKAALRSAFRIVIPGLPAERIATVSAIEVRAKRAEGTTGAERSPTKSAGEMEIPNIKLTMSPVDLKPWQQWHDEMVVKGGNQEKTMRVEFLDATMKNPLAAIELNGVGIVAIRTPKAEANSEQIARVEIELYAEQLKFSPTGGGGATASAASEQPKEAAPTEAPKSEPVLDRPIRRAR